MKNKERLTVTVDADLIEAANKAVSEGRVGSLSGWVNLALTQLAAKERRMRSLVEAVTAYEEQFGEITSDELIAQEHEDRQGASALSGRKRRVRS